MDNYFQNIFPKISGSQEDNQISIFGCPHSFFGCRGHKDTRILLPCIDNIGQSQKYRAIYEVTIAGLRYCLDPLNLP